MLVPEAIDRAAGRRVKERAQRTGESLVYSAECAEVLDAFAEEKKSYVMSPIIASRRRFVRETTPAEAEESTTQEALDAFEADWRKECIEDCRWCQPRPPCRRINRHLQQRYGVSVTVAGIIDAVHVDEIPAELQDLLRGLGEFAAG